MNVDEELLNVDSAVHTGLGFGARGVGKRCLSELGMPQLSHPSCTRLGIH